jgi:hypothetical protein
MTSLQMTQSEEGPSALPRLAHYLTTCFTNWTSNFSLRFPYTVNKEYYILNYHPLINA